jgi:hypothetical protein
VTPCAHLDHVLITQLPESVAGCEDCLASGGRWLHLRISLAESAEGAPPPIA